MPEETITAEMIQAKIEQAKTNPAVAASLRTRLESGTFDSQLKELGLQVGSSGLEKFQPGRIRETISDIAQVGTGFAEGVTESSERIQEAGTARRAGEQGLGRTLLQQTGIAAGSGAKAIGELFTGAFKVALSQKAEDKLKGVAENLGERVAQTPVVQGLAKWYDGLDEAQQRDVDAAGGVLALATEFAGTGAAKKAIAPVARGAKNTLIQAGEKIAGGVDAFKGKLGEIKTPNFVRTAKESLGALPPATKEEAVSKLTNAFNDAFVTDSVATSNKLRKLSQTQNVPEESLVRELAGELKMPDIKGSLADFSEHIDDLGKRRGVISEKIGEALGEFKVDTPVDDLRKQVLNFAQTSGRFDSADIAKTLREVNRMFDGFKQKFGEALTPTQLNKIRAEMNKRTKAFDKEIFVQDSADAIADTMRTRIDEIVGSGAVREANKEVGRLFRLEKTAKLFDNRKINIGALGQQMGRLIAVTGAAPIGLAVAGPGGLVVAGIIAHFGGEVAARMMRKRLFDPKTIKVFKEALQQQPDVLKKLADEATGANKKFLTKLLEAPKEGAPKTQFGSKGTLGLTAETVTTTEAREALKRELGIIKQQSGPRRLTMLEKLLKDKKTAQFIKENIDPELLALPAPKAGSPRSVVIKGEVIPLNKVSQSTLDDIVDALESARREAGEIATDTGKVVKKKPLREGSLIKEAKKFGSAEEFIEARGARLFHGSKDASSIEKSGFNLESIGKGSGSRGVYGEGIYLTNRASGAKLFGKVLDVHPARKLNLFETKDVTKDIFGAKTNHGDPAKITEVFESEGYDGIKLTGKSGESEVVVFDPSLLKTKSQLTDIWKKANK